MPIEVIRTEDTNELITIVSGKVRGMDTSSADLDIAQEFYPLLQNVDTLKGRVIRQDGATLHTTSFITTDNQSPLGVGQYRSSSGTDQFVWIQQNGDVNRWTGSATAILATEGITAGTTNWFSVVQFGDYLIFSNPTDGNWKWDGTNWLPLGAKIINNCQNTTNWALTGTGQTGLTTSTTAAFGTNSLTSDAMLASETATLTYDPATLDVDDGLLLATDYTENDRLCFWFRTTDASTINTTTTLVRIETSVGNDFDIAASAWTDENGNTITLTDNTWHRVELVISGGTEAGTYDHTSVDNVHWVIATNGTGGMTWNLDQVYMQYAAAAVMPGCQVNAEWKNVFFGGNSGVSQAGTAAQTSGIFFSKAGAPDEYTNTATQQVDEDDGDDVTGMKKYYNQLFITKENACYSLGGSLSGTIYPDYFLELIPITFEHGCSSHRSMVERDKKLYMWWRNYLWVYNGTGTSKISDAIDDTLIDVDETLLDLIVAAPYQVKQEIWWSYPTDSAVSPDMDAILKYNWFTNGFSTGTGTGRDLNALMAPVESGAVTLVSVRANGRFLTEDSGTTFDTNNITSIFRLPWMSAKRPDLLKYWSEMMFQYPTTTGTITVQSRLADHPREFAGASFATIESVNMANTNEERVLISQVSRWIQIQFTSTNVAFEIEMPIHIWAVPVGQWA